MLRAIRVCKVNYYNENDPKAAAWLRELVKGNHIAPGEVDERSIEDVFPNDLKDYKQCHFFAGIGGWSYALRLAGVPDSTHVWTGSCPCQPFSAAGKGKGVADERHLWPAWLHLIRACRPERIYGEQVANALPWVDLVSGDLEAEDYALWAAIVGAHSGGAPHIRQRLYWVADAYGTRLEGWEKLPSYGPARLPWTRSVELLGTDSLRRNVEPGTFPLAHGVSGRVGLLRGYGNAIVPQVAATFIKAAEVCLV